MFLYWYFWKTQIMNELSISKYQTAAGDECFECGLTGEPRLWPSSCAMVSWTCRGGRNCP